MTIPRQNQKRRKKKNKNKTITDGLEMTFQSTQMSATDKEMLLAEIERLTADADDTSDEDDEEEEEDETEDTMIAGN